MRQTTAMPTRTEASDSDAALVERVRSGEAAAFDDLVRKYQDRVFNTCYRMCGNHADAADLTQTAFVRAYRSLGAFRGQSGFFTWLFRIAANVALSHRRRRGPRLVSLAEPDGPAAPVRGPARAGDGCDPLERAEAQQQLESALARIDEEFRIVVILKDVEDLEYAAIAEVLNVPIGTVKSRLHRGRMMLRDLLRQEDL